MNFRLKINAPAMSLFFISLMLIIPFVFPNLPKPIPTFYKEWLAAACALLAFIPLIRQTAWPRYQAPSIIWLPIVMLCIMGLQLAILDIAYWQHYFLVAQYFLVAALLMLLGGMLKQAMGFDRVMHRIAIILIISGLLSVLAIMLDLRGIHLAGWVLNRSSGAVANVGQQNHLATLLGLAIASLVYMFAKQKLSSWLTFPLLTLLLSGLALTASRSAWVFVLLIALSGFAFGYSQKMLYKTSESANQQRLRALLLLPILFYLLQIGLPFLSTDKPITTTNQRLIELAQKPESARLQLYQAAWHVYADNPLLGKGFGQMAWHDINHAEHVPQLKGTIAHAHNIVLQFLAETGAVGTTVLLVCILAFVWRVKSAPITPERWLWWLMLSIIGIHAMLEYPLWYIHFLALTALLLGLGDIQSHSLVRYRPQLVITVLAILWMGSLVQTMHDFRIVQRWFYQNQHIALSVTRFDEMYKQFKPIRAFSPIAIYAEVQLANTLPINRDGLKDKLSIYKRLLSAHPSPGLTYNYGLLLALDGRQSEAINHLKHTFMRYPEGIDQHWQIATKIAVQGEHMLFKYIKFIEHLRDGEPLDTGEPMMMDGKEFNQPPIKPLPNATRV